MIYVTGDMHGDIKRFKDKAISSLKKDDLLIVCGDFGFLWDNSREEQKNIKWLSKRRYKIAFVEGCNENYSLLEKYPVEQWHSGDVRRISKNIVQLLRGEIFNVDDVRVLAFGGGDNSDVVALTGNQPNDGKEAPTPEQLDNAIKNLDVVSNKVDFIVTHDIPTSTRQFMFINDQQINYTNICLEQINKLAKYQTWFFGKYHVDKKISNSCVSVFKAVIPITQPRKKIK